MQGRIALPGPVLLRMTLDKRYQRSLQTLLQPWSQRIIAEHCNADLTVCIPVKHVVEALVVSKIMTPHAVARAIPIAECQPGLVVADPCG